MEVKVNKGDNIWKIAKANKPPGVELQDFVQQIIAANTQLADADELQIGDVIQVPGVDIPTPKPRPVPPEERWRAREEATRAAMLRFRTPEQQMVGEEVEIELPRPRPEYVAQAMTMPSADDRHYFTMGDPGGLAWEGNINLASRSGKGGIRAKAMEWQGRHVLVPMTAAGGHEMGDYEALKAYLDSGDNYGVFDDEGAAIAYAQRLELGIGTPERDPDAYIDTNSPRFWEMFEGSGQARDANAEVRRGMMPDATPAERAATRTRAGGQVARKATAKATELYARRRGSRDPAGSSQLDVEMFRQKTEGWAAPTFQPTRPK